MHVHLSENVIEFEKLGDEYKQFTSEDIFHTGSQVKIASIES